MSDYIKEEKLNLEEVGRYFESKGYRVQKLEQPHRHVVGLVKFENEKLFLKLASSPAIGDRTVNESSWNKNLNTVWKKYITTVKTPKIFDEGFFEDRYWFVGEYVFGKPLVWLKDKKLDISENDLNKSVEIVKDIMDLTKVALLPRDVECFNELIRTRVYEMARVQSKNTKRDTGKLLQFIKDRVNCIEIGTSHGDYVPWSIMKTQNREYYLIDSEDSQMAGLKFYDVANYYHGVYTKLKRPDLAEIFLTKFKKLYKWTEEKEREFAPVLASRIIGGYFEAERDEVTSLDLNMEMEKKLIN